MGTCREPLGEPRRFSRRVPTSRRALESRPQEFDSCLLTSATLTDSLPDFSSCPLLALHALSSGGEAGQERRSHDGDSDYVVAAFKILIFRSHVLKMSTAVPSGP